MGLKEIGDLKTLTLLDLGFTKVTDAGMKDIANLKNLEYLFVVATKVTDSEVADLRKSLPKAAIMK